MCTDRPTHKACTKARFNPVHWKRHISNFCEIQLLDTIDCLELQEDFLPTSFLSWKPSSDTVPSAQYGVAPNCNNATSLGVWQPRVCTSETTISASSIDPIMRSNFKHGHYNMCKCCGEEKHILLTPMMCSPQRDDVWSACNPSLHKTIATHICCSRLQFTPCIFKENEPCSA